MIPNSQPQPPPAIVEEESLPSNTSEEITATGINLLGIEREIIPTDSMCYKNTKADGGEWNLVDKENEIKFWERKAILRDRFKNNNQKMLGRKSFCS